MALEVVDAGPDVGDWSVWADVTAVKTGAHFNVDGRSKAAAGKGEKGDEEGGGHRSGSLILVGKMDMMIGLNNRAITEMLRMMRYELFMTRRMRVRRSCLLWVPQPSRRADG